MLWVPGSVPVLFKCKFLRFVFCLHHFQAQLRKRQEMDGAGDGSPVQLSKSPKSPFQARALGSRVLHAGVEKEER